MRWGNKATSKVQREKSQCFKGSEEGEKLRNYDSDELFNGK